MDVFEGAQTGECEQAKWRLQSIEHKTVEPRHRELPRAVNGLLKETSGSSRIRTREIVFSLDGVTTRRKRQGRDDHVIHFPPS